eukprot:COSAG01_NODE_18388_length_1079_cov_1.030612_1_plen_320_part_10
MAAVAASATQPAPPTKRHRALLGKAQYTHEETARYREQKKRRPDRVNAVITQVLSRQGKTTLPKIVHRRHVGAITGESRRRKQLETSKRARAEAADTQVWDPTKQWHYLPVCAVDAATGLQQPPTPQQSAAALDAVLAGAGQQRRQGQDDVAVIRGAELIVVALDLVVQGFIKRHRTRTLTANALFEEVLCAVATQVILADDGDEEPAAAMHPDLTLVITASRPSELPRMARFVLGADDVTSDTAVLKDQIARNAQIEAKSAGGFAAACELARGCLGWLMEDNPFGRLNQSRLRAKKLILDDGGHVCSFDASCRVSRSAT